MGIYGALTTAVTGLTAQSFALENISGNIANSQTTAFKRTDTRFVDYVVENSPNRQKSGIVSAFSKQTNDVQGDIVASSSSTSMGINGDGYFIVEKLFDFSDRQPIFNGENLYARRGDFEVDRFGHLVNGGGYYLKGLPVDIASGNVSGDVPEVIKIPNDFLGAKETTQVNLRANVPSDPRTVLSGSGTAPAGAEMLLDTTIRTGTANTAAAPANNSTRTGPAVIDDAVTPGSEKAFLESSIAGGAITVYNENGAPLNVQMRWAKVEDAREGAETREIWNLYYKSGDGQYTRVDPDNGPATAGQFVFQSDGKIDHDATFGGGTNPYSATIATLNVGGQTVSPLTMSFGANGLTQYADPSGAYQATELDQDGYPAGEMVDVEVTDLNRIRANYSNGISIDVAEIPLVSFNAPNMLRSLDGGGYAKTNQSGNPIQGAEGTIIGGSLEASNTDIADEFSKLIITQQAYSANTRIVSSADEMMQETLNMKR